MKKKAAPPSIEILARGACVKRGQVVICRNRKHGNVYLPGGHVDWGEDSRRALAREWQEELGVPGRVGRFLGVVEQVYEARNGRTSEISLVFEVICPKIPANRDPASAEDHLAFEWVSLKDLASSGLLPEALAASLPSWCAQAGAAADRWQGFSAD